ncbi:MAG: HAD family phosphatase [Clostridiales bacterium]|nr:HAD family phosphatase [Clostridiales bacterium]MDY6117161.1 HAD family phosphatase [Anaerovoracaceae bacterium]
MIKGVIFDVDGTLFDSMGAWHDSGYNVLKSLGIDADKRIGDIFFSMTMDEVVDYIKENFSVNESRDFLKNGIHNQVEYAYRNEIELKPGVMRILDWMKDSKIPATIATSTDRFLIEIGLARLGIEDYFDEIYTATEVGKGKNYPDIFQLAMDKMGTKPEETWLFEDGLYSMITAKAYGMPVVGVYDKVSHDDQEAIKQVADIYLEDLRDLNFEDFLRR